MSPLAFALRRGAWSTRPGRDHVTTCRTSRIPPLPRVVVGWGGAPTGGRCPVFSTTALQDLGLQLQLHLTPLSFGLGWFWQVFWFGGGCAWLLCFASGLPCSGGLPVLLAPRLRGWATNNKKHKTNGT